MIKTFPLQFTDKELDDIAITAAMQGESKKTFMLKAIAERMARLKGAKNEKDSL